MAGGPASPPETDVEPPPEPADEDDLGYVDGTKLTLPSKLIKVALFVIFLMQVI